MPRRRQRRRGDPNVRIRRRELGPIIANEYGPASMRTMVYVSNSRGDKLGTLDNVQALSIDMSNFRETTWNCTIEMDRNGDFNPLNDWIKVEHEVLVAGTWFAYPRGVYKFEKKGGSHYRTQSRWSLEGFSAELLLLENGPEQGYKVPAGTRVLRKVEDIIRINTGIDPARLKLPMSEDKETNTTRVYDPVQDETYGTWIGICNALLKSAAFAALYVDDKGNFLTDRLKDIQEQDPAVYYGPGLEEEPIILDGVDDTYDDERFANKIVVTSEDPNQAQPIFAVARNTNPNSAGSRQNYGKWKTKKVARPNIVDKESARKLARSQLRVASGFLQTLGYRTPPDPERAIKEYHHMHIPLRGEPDIYAPFRNAGFTQDCYPSPKEMSFSSSRTERI